MPTRDLLATIPDPDVLLQDVAPEELGVWDIRAEDAISGLISKGPTHGGDDLDSLIALMHRVPLFADAYVALSHGPVTKGERGILLSRAVRAGEAYVRARTQGLIMWWRDIVTRPYMRASAALALHCAQMGRMGDAIDQLKALLILNPHDDQGVREALIGFLVQEKRWGEAVQIISGFSRDTDVVALYARVLIAWQDEREDDPSRGHYPRAEAALHRALSVNALFAAALGDTEIFELAPGVMLGEHKDDVAIASLGALRNAWEAQPEALGWLFLHTLKQLHDLSRAPLQQAA